MVLLILLVLPITLPLRKKAGWKDSLKANNKGNGQRKVVNKVSGPSLSSLDHSDSNRSEALINTLYFAKAVLTLNPVLLADTTIRAGRSFVANRKEKSNEKRLQSLAVDEKTGFHLKTNEMTKDEDMKHINPSFGNFDKNTKNNCMLCTTAYELRRRGYDVVANKASTGYVTSTVNTFFPKAKIESVGEVPKTYAELRDLRKRMSWPKAKKELVNNTVEALKKQGDGARGNLMVQWAKGGGHSVVYEVDNGEVVLRDCQTNKVYKNPSKIISHSLYVEYARTDNVEFDLDKIREVVH